MDPAGEQEKLEATRSEMLENAAESPASSAPRHEGGLHVSPKKLGRNGSILQLADV